MCKRVLKTGLVYLSGVIGAGFITGREIYSYFGRFGIKGFVGIIISWVLFAITAYRMMNVIFEQGCEDMEDTAKALFGKRAGRAVCIAQIVFLYSMYIVMLAGLGELLASITRLSRPLCGLFAAVGSVIFLFAGFDKIASVCAWVAPVTAVIMITVLLLSGNFKALFAKDNIEGLFHGGNFLWVGAAVVYCGYNLLVLLSVMPRVAAGSQSVGEARLGGVLGATVVGALLFTVNAGMFGAKPSCRAHDMPLLWEAARHGAPLAAIMLGAVLLTMLLSAAVNLSNCGRELSKAMKCRERTAGVLLSLVGFCLSFVGFGPLMDVFYTFFGVFAVMLIIPLVFRTK